LKKNFESYMATPFKLIYYNPERRIKILIPLKVSFPAPILNDTCLYDILYNFFLKLVTPQVGKIKKSSKKHWKGTGEN